MKRGDHMKAARLLIRVANSISKFPSRKSASHPHSLSLSLNMIICRISFTLLLSPILYICIASA